MPPDPSGTLDAEAGQQARFWNRMARRYAAARIMDPAGYEKTLGRVQSLLAPEDSVLEIGCGTGTTALRLAPSVRSMLATDVSPEMIRIANEKLAAQPLPQLRFAVFDAPSLLSQGPVYDAVLAFNMLHLLPALEPTLRAMHAALRPGGLAISKTPCLAEMNPLITRVAVPLARAIGLAPPVRSLDAAMLRDAFERCGFAVEALERHGSKPKDWRVFIVARRGS